LGAEGVLALETFVRMGGTLVCLNGSSDFAIAQLHLPVKNVVGEVERENFFLSGSIIEMTVDPSHPVMAGMPERSKVFVSRSPVFTVTDEFQGAVLAKYQEKGSPLVSGYLLGEEHLHGFAAALDVRHGDGHVVLLGMRPQWRGQPFGNFRIVFNALLYTREMAATVRPNGAFWTAPEPETEATAEENRGS
jgi:ribosomal protein S18 acetylase RimI-like enzyme